MSEIQPFYPVTVVTIERIERDELYAKWGPYADDSSYEGISFILPIHDQTAEGQHAFDEWIENPFAERFCDILRTRLWRRLQNKICCSSRASCIPEYLSCFGGRS